jgi:hypothetical protein
MILKTLLEGHPVLIDGEDWYYQDGVFGPKRVMTDTSAGTTRDVLIGVDWSLAAFVQWCEKLPEDALIEMAFRNGLASAKKEKKPRLTPQSIEDALAKSAAGIKDLEPGLQATFGPFPNKRGL